jgi:hypothetical protein
MEDYFAGEQRGRYVLVGLGVAGLASGALLYRSSSLRARGASYPLLSVGVLHLAAGIFIYFSSAGRIDKFGDQIERDAPAFVKEERRRMKGDARLRHLGRAPRARLPRRARAARRLGEPRSAGAPDRHDRPRRRVLT